MSFKIFLMTSSADLASSSVGGILPDDWRAGSGVDRDFVGAVEGWLGECSGVEPAGKLEGISVTSGSWLHVALLGDQLCEVQLSAGTSSWSDYHPARLPPKPPFFVECDDTQSFRSTTSLQLVFSPSFMTPCTFLDFFSHSQAEGESPPRQPHMGRGPLSGSPHTSLGCTQCGQCPCFSSFEFLEGHSRVPCRKSSVKVYQRAGKGRKM